MRTKIPRPCDMRGMKRIFSWIEGKIVVMTISIMMVCAISCQKETGQADSMTSFPKPTAYPRLNLPDTAMVAADSLSLVFYVNKEAETAVPKDGWLDITYPTLGAVIHTTFSKTAKDKMESVKENRMERLMLNAGDGSLKMSEFTNKAGFDVVLAEGEGSLTPIQFLATDESAWVVSGAAYFSDKAAVSVYDSIKPAVAALRDDLLKALSRLDYK